MTPLSPSHRAAVQTPTSQARPEEPLRGPEVIIGRDDVLAEIQDLIDHGDLPVVTLLGPGGVGKTRLATEILLRMGPAFVDGGRFIDLQAARDAQDVVDNAARTLGLHQGDSPSFDEGLRDAFGDRHILLVVDNVEHVLESAARLVQDILRSMPRARVLVTGRAPLGIAAEQHYPVPPLDTSKRGMEPNAAMQLFLLRARAVNPSFHPNRSQVDVIAKICRQLDGLPLAIELAAARTRTMSPDTILERLADRWALLSGGTRDAPRRLRSMRDAIGWSYDLLSDGEKELFRTVSIFAGDFTLEEAEFVHRWPRSQRRTPPTFETLQSLVDQSLVATIDAPDETRFRMLETIREFARAQADRGSDNHAAQAAYIRDLAHRFEDLSTGPDQALWLERLESDLPNVLATISWLEEQQRLREAIEIVTDISFFIHMRGHTQTFLPRLMAWLDHPQVRAEKRLRGQVLLSTGLINVMNGQHALSVSMFQEAVNLLQETGDESHRAAAKAFLCVALRWSDDVPRAAEVAAEVLADARVSGAHRQECIALLVQATDAAITHRQEDRADALFRQSQRIAEQHGDLWMMAYTSMAEAEGAFHKQQFDVARKAARRARALQDTLKSRTERPTTWWLSSEIERRQGDLEAASTMARRGIESAREIGRTGQVISLTLQLANIEIEREALQDAALLLAESLRLSLRQGDPSHIARCIGRYASLAARSGEMEMAARFLGHHARLREVQDLDPGEGASAATDAREQVRTALGPSAFDRAYREGHDRAQAEFSVDAMAWSPPADAGLAAEGDSLDHGLSLREQDVLVQMANGLNNQEIADALFVSLRTVTTHVTSILSKLDVPSRTAAVAYAIRHGLA